MRILAAAAIILAMKTRTLIEHATVVTLDDEGRILSDASVAIAGDKILAIGEPPAGFEPDERLDLGGRVVMPGLYNAHTHAAMTFARGYAEDISLEHWFNDRIWRLESALTTDMVYWGTLLALVEMIRGGVIGFGDHYFHMRQVLRAVQEAGVRANLAWAVFGGAADGEVGITIPETVAFVREVEGLEDDRLRAVLGPHSPYQCPDVFLARTAAVAVPRGNRHPYPRCRDRRPIEQFAGRLGHDPDRALGPPGPVRDAHYRSARHPRHRHRSRNLGPQERECGRVP